MMNFRAIKAGIISILGAAAGGSYQVIGYQPQALSDENVKDTNRTVQAYYASGSFPKSAGSISGPMEHEMTFRIECTASAAAVGDLAALDNPASTPAEIQAAIAGFSKAADRVDNLIDELIDEVYQALMDASEYDLGQPFTVADKWIDGIRKGQPSPRGSLVVLTATLNLTCSIEETVDGDSALNVIGGVLQPTTIDVDVRVNDDANEGRAGVEQTNPAP